jgi:hypothetical protein
MTLDDLVARYTPERSLDERRGLLEAIARHLPAPEFLWYDLALQALHGETAELKPAAVALLAHAPRSWHQVLMTALTDLDETLQLAAVEALHAHALAEPERRDAYRSLGVLPGWRQASLARWAELAEGLADAPVPEPLSLGPIALTPGEFESMSVADELADARDELGALQAELAQLEVRILELEQENFDLRADRERLRELFEGEKLRADRLAADLAVLQERHEALHLDLLAQVEHLKTQQEGRVAELQGDLDRARGRQRRTLAAGMLAMSLVVMAGISVSHRSSVMAMSPEELPARPPAPVQVVRNEAAPAQIAARATALGYSKALGRLVAEAEALEGEGRSEQALAVWQAVVRIAPSPQEASYAQRAAHKLVQRLRARKAARAAATTRTSPRGATRVVAPPPAQPAAPAADPIPADIRDKF